LPSGVERAKSGAFSPTLGGTAAVSGSAATRANSGIRARLNMFSFVKLDFGLVATYDCLFATREFRVTAQKMFLYPKSGQQSSRNFSTRLFERIAGREL
jgi:hypothetical protein